MQPTTKATMTALWVLAATVSFVPAGVTANECETEALSEGTDQVMVDPMPGSDEMIGLPPLERFCDLPSLEAADDFLADVVCLPGAYSDAADADAEGVCVGTGFAAEDGGAGQTRCGPGWWSMWEVTGEYTPASSVVAGGSGGSADVFMNCDGVDIVSCSVNDGEVVCEDGPKNSKKGPGGCGIRVTASGNFDVVVECEDPLNPGAGQHLVYRVTGYDVALIEEWPI